MASNTPADAVTADTGRSVEQENVHAADEKAESSVGEKHLEKIDPDDQNLVYDDVDEEPELHARTYVALLSMFALNLVQVFALQSPPAVVSDQRRRVINSYSDNPAAIIYWKEPQQYQCTDVGS